MVCPATATTTTTSLLEVESLGILLFIYLSINGLSTGGEFKNVKITPYKIKVYNCKLIDVVIRI